jgi:4'-phosphopantetheinyl transferase
MIEVYWMEQRATDVPPHDDWLIPAERERLAGMRFAKRRGDWRLGRWTAKRALAALGTADVARIEIRAAPGGAPEVFCDNRPVAATISLSHSGGSALCVVARAGCMLGCDLEVIEERGDAFLADYFTSGEQALIHAAQPADRPRLATLIWSAKESVLKALRTGLRLDTRCVEVRSVGWDDVQGWSPLEICYAGGQIFPTWWRQTGALLGTVTASPPPLAPVAVNV